MPSRLSPAQERVLQAVLDGEDPAAERWQTKRALMRKGYLIRVQGRLEVTTRGAEELLVAVSRAG